MVVFLNSSSPIPVMLFMFIMELAIHLDDNLLLGQIEVCYIVSCYPAIIISNIEYFLELIVNTMLIQKYLHLLL